MFIGITVAAPIEVAGENGLNKREVRSRGL